MGKEAECCTTNLIDAKGTFNAKGLDAFIEQTKLGECGLSYAIVAIMGPQSSGKSTLMNHLFNTNFKEMNALVERKQTTKGVWIAKSVGIEPCTIVMDIEGTDGRERGEDDTAFEKQSTLFAIAVSDIILMNMWCHDVGRLHAGSKPLLKIVFHVMLRLSFVPRKKTFMFVLRDQTKTPLEILENDLSKDIEETWDSVRKPKAYQDTKLSDIFNVTVVALSSYERNEKKFEEEVATLRQKFFHSIAPHGLAGDRREVVPASGFSISAQKIWKTIKENKDLDLPAVKVMVSTVRCEEIARRVYSSFVSNKDWLELEKAVQSHFVPDFGIKLNAMLYTCLSSYDEEVTYFEDDVRSAKRKQLEEQLMQLVQQVIKLMLKHLSADALNGFEIEFNNALKEGQEFSLAARDCTNKSLNLFNEQCAGATRGLANCDFTKTRNKLSHLIYLHIREVEVAKLAKLYEGIKKESMKHKLLNGNVKLAIGSTATVAVSSVIHIKTDLFVTAGAAAAAANPVVVIAGAVVVGFAAVGFAIYMTRKKKEQGPTLKDI